MRKTIVGLFFVTFLFLAFCGSMAYAKGQGKGKMGSSRSGWEKGTKQGWQSDVPRGQSAEGEKRLQENREQMRERKRTRHDGGSEKKLEDRGRERFEAEKKKGN